VTKPKAKAKAQPKPLPCSFVTFLLDRSGSMGSIKAATIEGFNTYLTGLQAEKAADIRFTFLQFDSESLDKCAVAEPVGEVPLLTHATFLPRGGTPLIDATYKTIKAVEEAVAKEKKKPRVVICVQTDGEENQSREHTWNSLSALVKAKQEEGWQFNFMGAGIDAYKQAAQMGISRGATMSYNPQNLAMTRAAFASSGSNTSLYATGESASMNYLAEQKLAAGDVFDPDLNALGAKLKAAKAKQDALRAKGK
jgi:uncharacterized protein YegL